MGDDISRLITLQMTDHVPGDVAILQTRRYLGCFLDELLHAVLPEIGNAGFLRGFDMGYGEVLGYRNERYFVGGAPASRTCGSDTLTDGFDVIPDGLYLKVSVSHVLGSLLRMARRKTFDFALPNFYQDLD